MMVDRETFVQVAPWLAIAGNALLTPPLQAGAQSAAIFDACLWEELAACEDAEVANAVDKLVKYLDGREETAAASREAQTGDISFFWSFLHFFPSFLYFSTFVLY